MAKRKSYKKRYSKKRSFSFLKWLVFGGFAIFAVFLSYKFLTTSSVCANSISCVKDLSGAYVPGDESIFIGKKVTAPKFVADDIFSQRVLGETTEPKHIYVNLTNQRLQAFEGDKKVLEFPVSTGKWFPTPTGDFKVWIKLRYTRMSGGNPSDNTYYNLANVPYVMFFSGPNAEASRGFSLHGAYWHNNFGYPMSHGCVNIRPEDAKKLFYWVGPVSDGDTTHASDLNPGTSITIYGQPPV